MIEKINRNDITKSEFMSIIYNTAIKLIRGLLIKPLFKKSKGLVFVGNGTKIFNKNKIIIGKNNKFESNCEVQGLSKRGIEFGDNVTIGKFAMIRPSSYYGVEIGEGIKIGNNSSVGPFGYIGCAGYITIGDNVMIGPRVSMFAENHNFSEIGKSIKEQGVNQKGIIIEDDCWIGSGVVILDGVKIGKGSIISAGTIITKDIPPYSKVIDRRDKVIINRKED
ncbi:DapH/DapD/GlmU-related protein [uncultured Clostridium sp.]|uniref:acyltransferase n=1 Tax=uncultured Clostridium sp. TaxID=59620 RepID=UPI0026715196|nr:acyltransferase [uncultured Clostridium sp.]